jgi:hypothetical protein
MVWMAIWCGVFRSYSRHEPTSASIPEVLSIDDVRRRPFSIRSNAVEAIARAPQNSSIFQFAVCELNWTIIFERRTQSSERE